MVNLVRLLMSKQWRGSSSSVMVRSTRTRVLRYLIPNRARFKMKIRSRGFMGMIKTRQILQAKCLMETSQLSCSIETQVSRSTRKCLSLTALISFHHRISTTWCQRTSKEAKDHPPTSRATPRAASSVQTPAIQEFNSFTKSIIIRTNTNSRTWTGLTSTLWLWWAARKDLQVRTPVRLIRLTSSKWSCQSRCMANRWSVPARWSTWHKTQLVDLILLLLNLWIHSLIVEFTTRARRRELITGLNCQYRTLKDRSLRMATRNGLAGIITMKKKANISSSNHTSKRATRGTSSELTWPKTEPQLPARADSLTQTISPAWLVETSPSSTGKITTASPLATSPTWVTPLLRSATTTPKGFNSTSNPEWSTKTDSLRPISNNKCEI